MNPGKVHVTLPRGRRISRRGGEGYELHFEDLAPSDLAWWEGIPSVTLRKAIDQCIASEAQTHLMEQAIERGQMLGLILGEEAEGLHARLEARNGGL